MREFSLYSYQCWPILPKKTDDDMFAKTSEEMEIEVRNNMKLHQHIIDDILTRDVEVHFSNVRQEHEGDKTISDFCLAFIYKHKAYYFKILLPHHDDTNMSNSIFVIRIANSKRVMREQNFKRTAIYDEPSALVIIDNRNDQQRILIEHTRAWKDTDTVSRIIQENIGRVLKHHYNLGLRIEPVWQKDTFSSIVRAYKDRIRTVTFDIGYPNMGRTGNKFLMPLKESLASVGAAGKITYTTPKPSDYGLSKNDELQMKFEPRNTLDINVDEKNSVVMEMAEHCRANGRQVKIVLDDGHQVYLMKVPKKQLKGMSPEQRKRYEETGQNYSNVIVQMSDKVGEFNGNDDLFKGTEEEVLKCLNKLKLDEM